MVSFSVLRRIIEDHRPVQINEFLVDAQAGENKRLVSSPLPLLLRTGGVVGGSAACGAGGWERRTLWALLGDSGPRSCFELGWWLPSISWSLPMHMEGQHTAESDTQARCRQGLALISRPLPSHALPPVPRPQSPVACRHPTRRTDPADFAWRADELNVNKPNRLLRRPAQPSLLVLELRRLGWQFCGGFALQFHPSVVFRFSLARARGCTE